MSTNGGTQRRRSEGRTKVVQSAARAMRILGLLVRNPQGKRLTEISRELRLDKSTAHRLLHTLITERVVTQDSESGRYRFSPLAWLQLAPYLQVGQSLADETQQILDNLANSTGATCILSFVDESFRAMAMAMYALSPRPLRFDPTASPAAPAHAVASGKCYLAGLSESELTEWLKEGLPKLTDRTVTSPDRLREELALVREQRHALSRGEFLEEVHGIAVPVFDDRQKVFGGLALVGAGSEVSEQALLGWLPRLHQAAARISFLVSRGVVATASESK